MLELCNCDGLCCVAWLKRERGKPWKRKVKHDPNQIKVEQFRTLFTFRRVLAQFL